MNIRKIIREEIDDIFTDIHGKKSSPVDYTAVLIEGDEIAKFESELSKRLDELNISIPEGWTRSDNYHMTITTGELGLGLKMKGIIGLEVEMKVHSIGVSDKAMAVGVEGLFSRNEVQHITIAFKDRPADSNDIVQWTGFEPFHVTGYVREVRRPGGEFGRIKTKEI